MLFTATTVKDTTENIEAFVRDNLRAGADHMLLFIEGDDAEDQAATFEGHPHVTAIPTNGDRYWLGGRPMSLNGRQVGNATLAATALAALPWVEWVFHIDGDERLHLDRSHLAALPDKVKAVRLDTMEAASDGTGDVRLFKRLLTPSELDRLHHLGMIDRPANPAYFRGQVSGKPGVRPSPLVRLGVHRARTHHGVNLVHHNHESLAVLHYEGITPDSFIRKWTNMATTRAQHNKGALVLLERVRAILNEDTGPDERAARMRELYDERGRDDVDALHSMGLLVSPDPAWHQHAPALMDADQAAVFQDVLDLMLATDKRHFLPAQRGHYPIDALRLALSSRHVRSRPELAESLRLALTR